MKIKRRNLALAVLAGSLLLAGCGKDDGNYQKVTGPYLTGELAKYHYNGFVEIPLATLNSVKDQTGSNSQHIANFVDGLLENDEFGALKLALADSASKTPDSKEFTFTIKPGIKWLTNIGEHYSPLIKGVSTPQFVTADDFKNSLELNLDAKNESQTSYIPSVFIEGALEYNYYTEIIQSIKSGKPDRTGRFWSTSTTYAEVAEAISAYTGVEVLETDIDAVKNFQRVGIRTFEDDPLKIQFRLVESMPFFPTALTYTCFLPVNRQFIKQIGFSNFGTSAETFLFNGAFLLEQWDANKVVYRKNPEYWDVKNVHVDTMTYNNYPDNADPNHIRLLFEKGEVDAFGISENDTEGWAKYILGPDGTGTKQNPYHDDVYSRYVDSIDFNFHFMLNIERDITGWNQRHSVVTQNDILNWNRSTQLSSVRQLFLKGIDQKTYNVQRFTSDADSSQTQTFTMRGFVVDDVNRRDYIEYVYEAFADKFGLTYQQASDILAPGQTDYNGYTNLDFDQVQDLAAQALEDIQLYNSTVGVANPITFPIKSEYLSTNDATYYKKDQIWVRDANERMNGCTIHDRLVTDELPLCQNKQYPYFEIVVAGPDQIASSSDYIKLSDAHQYGIHIMGWAPDYGDPLTYLNCYTSKGEMSAYSGTLNHPDRVGYHNVDGVLVADSQMGDDGVERFGVTAKYDYLVNKAKNEHSDTAVRYELFAEAEVHLLTDLCLIRSIYNQGQGWFVSVSRLIGYETPNASYGLSSNKMKGVWVLKETVNAATRRSLKQQYDTAKANAPRTSIFD